MSTHTDEDTFQQIIEAEDFAPPCDSKFHGLLGDGPAEWIVHTDKRYSCKSGPYRLWCQGCLDRALHNPLPYIDCLDCGERLAGRSRDFIKSYEPIRKSS